MAVSAITGVTSAAQRQLLLEGFRDQILIDALAGLVDTAALAAKWIVDAAEAILTTAETCRWDNGEDVHSLHVSIAHYFTDHPRLTTLQDALNPLPDLVAALSLRGGRKLQLPRKRRGRQKALTQALDALTNLKAFADSLRLETEYLPTHTGLAARELGRLSDLTLQDAPIRVRAKESGEIYDLVAHARESVAQARSRNVSSELTAAVLGIREAFV